MSQEFLDEGADSLVLECDFDEPPEKVWKALTTPEHVAGWLMAGNIRAEEGHRFAFEADEEAGGSVECEVLAAEPARLLRYRWTVEAEPHALDSVVTFVLSETAEGGTRLRLTHSGLVGAAVMPVREFHTLMSAGLPTAAEPQQPDPIQPTARPPTTALYRQFRTAA